MTRAEFVICPWCELEYADDSLGFDDGDYECDHCEETFRVKTHVTYSTEKVEK